MLSMRWRTFINYSALSNNCSDILFKAHSTLFNVVAVGEERYVTFVLLSKGLSVCNLLKVNSPNYPESLGLAVKHFPALKKELLQ